MENATIITNMIDWNKLIGSNIKCLYGTNMNAYYHEKYTFFQFHKGFWIELENAENTNTIFFNGSIVEDASGDDIFKLSVKEDIFHSMEQKLKQNILYPRYISKANPKFMLIEDIALYHYKSDDLVEKMPFAVKINCTEGRAILIRFEFPADGLQVSFDKSEIEAFFKKDFFGKKLILSEIFPSNSV